jgi:hypothetical protein
MRQDTAVMVHNTWPLEYHDFAHSSIPSTTNILAQSPPHVGESDF